MGCYRKSPNRERFECHNAAMDAMSRALRKAAQSPFSDVIECMEMLRWFTRPPFTIYDGKTDPMVHVSHYIQMMLLYSHNDGLVHVSHYIQMMLLYSHNDGLMCKVFLSSLGSTTMR